MPDSLINQLGLRVRPTSFGIPYREHDTELSEFVARFGVEPCQTNSETYFRNEALRTLTELGFEAARWQRYYSVEKDKSDEDEIDDPDDYADDSTSEEDEYAYFLMVHHANKCIAQVSSRGRGARPSAHVSFRYTPEMDDWLTKVFEALKPHYAKPTPQPPQPASIGVIVPDGMGGYDTQSLQLRIPQTPIELNYDDDVLQKHEKKVLPYMSGEGKGVLLLHGVPGSGKTSYIRYLASELDKRFLYVPNEVSKEMLTPGFASFMLRQRNSILIMEDAEEVMRKRTKGNNSAVSAILNMGDGLLSDALGIMFICTFNCDSEEIDSALLRKGRLIEKMEFNKLEPAKATKLSTHLGSKKVYDKPVTVAEVYNP